jgi:hypothetical protein
MRRLLRLAAPLTLLAAGALTAQPFALTDPSSHTKAVSPDGAAIVTLNPLGRLAASTFPTALASAGFGSPWQFTTAGSFGGSFSVTQYDAGWAGGSASGGGSLGVTYDRGSALPAGRQLQWIQVITTNSPLGGTTSPYLDPRPNDDNLPFYWTSAELPAQTSGNTVSFTDFSKRPPAELATTDPVDWNAALYLVDWDGGTSVNVHDGISWGWQMRSATAGTSAARFTSPSPPCPPATCAGLGSSSFTWGSGASNELRITPYHFNPKPGDEFKLARIDYTNRTIAPGSEVSAVDLSFDIAFDNNPDGNHTLRSRLKIVNTPNTDDPAASADFVAFTLGGFSRKFNVFEDMSASADLMARIVATSTVVGDKDLDTPDPFSVPTYGLEFVSLTATSPGGFVTVSPEPQTALLIAAGLAGVWGVRRRRSGRA